MQVGFQGKIEHPVFEVIGMHPPFFHLVELDAHALAMFVGGVYILCNSFDRFMVSVVPSLEAHFLVFS